jgi:hypothetical protein
MRPGQAVACMHVCRTIYIYIYIFVVCIKKTKTESKAPNNIRGRWVGLGWDGMPVNMYFVMVFHICVNISTWACTLTLASYQLKLSGIKTLSRARFKFRQLKLCGLINSFGLITANIPWTPQSRSIYFLPRMAI